MTGDDRKAYSPERLTPRFEHDCDRCVFLGIEGEHDLYFCVQGDGRPTVVARYGDNGPDYTSALELADLIPALGVARRLARERGLLR